MAKILVSDALEPKHPKKLSFDVVFRDGTTVEYGTEIFLDSLEGKSVESVVSYFRSKLHNLLLKIAVDSEKHGE